jgi:3-hydroxyisobutyrate dehydrogenase-like beta-hydroxyacid dehydrogenase
MADRSGETIGFIGLGVMGEAMCRNLVRSGRWPVLAFDLDGEPLARLLQHGAKAARSASDLAEASDLVITCLPGGAEVRDLVLGQGALLEHLGAGRVLIDMSTSEPSLMREIEAVASARDIRVADAPIARTRQAAADGTLAIMVGADPALFERIEPILRTMGSDIVHCGGVGAGQVVKIMNNMVLFQTVLALSEAIAIAERSGVDGSTLLQTMAKGSGDSFALRHHGMKSIVPEIYPERAFSVTYALKDLSYALAMAEACGVSASGAANVKKIFEQAIEAGDGDRYFPVIRRLLTEV